MLKSTEPSCGAASAPLAADSLDRPSQPAVPKAVIILESSADAVALIEATRGQLSVPHVPCATVEDCQTAVQNSAAACLVVDQQMMADISTLSMPFPGLGRDVPTVVSTRNASPSELRRLMRRGVWDTFEKPYVNDTVVDVLNRALDEAVRRQADWSIVNDFYRRVDSLSKEEKRVLEAVCDGKLNKQIANEFGVSIRTVEQRRRRVFAKMNVPSAVPLARRVATVETLERLRPGLQVAEARASAAS